MKTGNQNPRADTAAIRITGAQIAPLLIGKMQFGKLGSIHVPLVTQELSLRNIAAQPKDGIRKLSEVLKENEHPQWKDRQATMNDEEMHNLKFFILDI